MGNVCCGGGTPERSKINSGFEAIDTKNSNDNHSLLTTISNISDHNNIDALVSKAGGVAVSTTITKAITTTQLTNQQKENVISTTTGGEQEQLQLQQQKQQQQLELEQQQKQKQIEQELEQQQQQQQQQQQNLLLLQEQEQQEQIRLNNIVHNTARVMVSVRSQRGSTQYYDQGFASALWQHLDQINLFTTSKITTTTSNTNTSTGTTSPGRSIKTAVGGEPLGFIRTLPTPVVVNNATNTTTTNNDNESIQKNLCQPSVYDSTILQDLTVSLQSAQNNVESKSKMKKTKQHVGSTTIVTNNNNNNNNNYDNPIMDIVSDVFITSLIPKKDQLFYNSGPIMESLVQQ